MYDDKVPPHLLNDTVDPAERPRAAGDAPEERVCMTCGQPFLSEGWHNRLCPRCRRRSEAEGW